MSDPSLALGLALVGLVLGPLVAWGLERLASWRALLDGFVLVTTAGLSLLFLMPHAFHEVGVWTVPIAVVGWFLPRLAERGLRRDGPEASRVVLSCAVAGLLLHCAIDGAALAVIEPGAGAAAATDRHDVTLAILSHRLPVGLFVWSALVPVAGRRGALAGLGSLMLATAAGFWLGPEVGRAVGPDVPWGGVVEALLAGGLLHVVLEHAPHGDEPSASRAAGIGALAALAVFALLPLEPSPALERALLAGVHLFVEASPAILIGFLGAGLLSLVPQETLRRWMRGKTALGSAVRGVVFGLPIPICSCGVVPLYRGLMQKGLPPAAAAAFLVATPELGVDAVAISLPLLGWEMTLVRIATATVLALCAGLAVAALTRDAASATPFASPEPEAERRGLRSAFHYGFVESLDELGPWILAGLVLAALLDPLLDPAWIAALPGVAEIPLFAAMAAPLYVCASAATPVGAAFLAKGVSAGAVMAFLLVGPATNVTTYGAVRAFHGVRTTLWLGGVVFGATLLLAALVNRFGGESLAPPVFDAADPHGTPHRLMATVFAGLLVVSLLRQGPRNFLGRLGVHRDHDDESAPPHA